MPHPSKNTRGHLRAEPSLQLGTLSTRIANLLCIIHLYYTLGAVAPLLPCLRTAAVRTHALGPHALCLTPRRSIDSASGAAPTLQITTALGKPDADLFIARKDRQTDANRTAAVLPVPSCKLGISSKSIHSFFSNLADRQTDRHRLTQKHNMLPLTEVMN